MFGTAIIELRGRNLDRCKKLGNQKDFRIKFNQSKQSTGFPWKTHFANEELNSPRNLTMRQWFRLEAFIGVEKITQGSRKRDQAISFLVFYVPIRGLDDASR